MSPPLPVTLLNPKDTSTGFVTYDWTPAIGAANSKTFRIGIQLGTNYIRNSQAEDALVTVSKPLGPRFITGGGSLTIAASSGLKAGNVDSVNGFGLGVKYSGTGSSPSGQFQTMVRSGANVYHVKSATLTSLVVTGDTAVLKGTASIYDVTNGSALRRLAGDVRSDADRQRLGLGRLGAIVGSHRGGSGVVLEWQAGSFRRAT